MHSRLLILVIFIFSILQVQASQHNVDYPSTWNNQLQSINLKLRQTTLPDKHAQILKSFRAKLLADINNSKDMNTPIFEKKISLFNRMNALFLDKFQISNCPSIKSRWELLKTSESGSRFEKDQIDGWLTLICQQ